MLYYSDRTLVRMLLLWLCWPYYGIAILCHYIFVIVLAKLKDMITHFEIHQIIVGAYTVVASVMFPNKFFEEG